MQLELKQAIIRPLTETDAPAIQRYANNRNIWLNVRDIFPHPYALEHAQGFIKFLSTQNPITNFAIAIDTEAIGCIGLRLGEDVHRKTAELGYWLGEPFWGRGIV